MPLLDLPPPSPLAVMPLPLIGPSLSPTCHCLAIPPRPLPHGSICPSISLYLVSPITLLALASFSPLFSLSPDARSRSQTSTIPLPPQMLLESLSCSSSLLFAPVNILSCLANKIVHSIITQKCREFSWSIYELSSTHKLCGHLSHFCYTSHK